MRFIPGLLLGIIFISVSCSNHKTGTPIVDEETYRKDHKEWQEKRLERLKSETGWLNLAGLYWLREGTNSFGSGPGNDIVFPGKADLYCGVLVLDGTKIQVHLADKVKMRHGDSLLSSMELQPDDPGKPTVIRHGDLSWHIIKRGERYGIRLRDLEHPRLATLDSVPAYPLNSSYRVEALLEPFDEALEMTVPTPVEGYTERYFCPGRLHFELDGEKLILFPFTSGKGYFLVFSDETTGMETYGAGRFLYTEPDTLGRLILDFNRATNPPCAFSPFATCPMPPRENMLQVAIEAGEQNLHLE